MGTLLKTWKTVLTIYKNNFQGEDESYKKGFEQCLKLFRVGLEYGESYNLRIKIKELEKQIVDRDKEIRSVKEQSKISKELVHKKLFISSTPTQRLIEYEVPNVVNGVGFNILTNMDRETFLACWYAFLSRNDFKRIDECKSKFMSYIKGHGHKGYICYKDKKTAKKEGAL